MDDLLSEFLTETAETMDELDRDLVELENNPGDPVLLGNIFRLVHTIKGTCGFLNLPRLESVAHCAETVLGQIRDGELAVSETAISLILEALDTIKEILNDIEKTGREPEGDDLELKTSLMAIITDNAGDPALSDPALSKPETRDTGGEAKGLDADSSPPQKTTDPSQTTDKKDGSPAPPDPLENAASSVPETLYEQLGGAERLHDLWVSLLKKATEDEALGSLFEGVETDDLPAKMTAYYSPLLGGPETFGKYSGPDFIIAMQTRTRKPQTEAIQTFIHHIQKTMIAHDVWGPTLEAITDILKESSPDWLFISQDSTPSSPAQTPAPDTPAPVPAADLESTLPLDANGKIATDSTIRVSVNLLENLMTMVSEMVLTRNQLMQILRTHSESQFANPLQRLNLITSELQEGVMKTRMQPIGNAWAKLPRIIRDLSRELGKKISLEMKGAETELDRQILDSIKDPLTHMVRNSADHGIEDPDTRLAAGKPAEGIISLNAFHKGGYIIIEIQDDGSGLDTEKIAQKAIENGLTTQTRLADMSPQEIQSFIMQPGFSTASRVTNISGRGVGMDVVKTNIEKIGGTIELASVQSRGSTFTIKIPLTLAIVSALIVECRGERFAIPQIGVLELVRSSVQGNLAIETIDDTPVMRLRNRLLTLVSLSDLLELDKPAHPLTRQVDKVTDRHKDWTEQQSKDAPSSPDRLTRDNLDTPLSTLFDDPESVLLIKDQTLDGLRDDPGFSPFQPVLADQNHAAVLQSSLCAAIRGEEWAEPEALDRLHNALRAKGFDDLHMQMMIQQFSQSLQTITTDPKIIAQMTRKFRQIHAPLLTRDKIDDENSGDRNSQTDQKSRGDQTIENQFIVVSQVGNYTFGIIVDRVYDTEEIVVKPVAPLLRNISLFSGNTILGDGSVIMILDLNGIAAASGELSLNSAQDALAMKQKDTQDEHTSILIFKAGDSIPKAVPVALISRLEEIDMADIKYSNDMPIIQYRGHLMPLIAINKDYQIKTTGTQPMIVFADRERSMGLIVDEIIDIVDESGKVSLSSQADGVLGNAIINGTTTDMIDTGYYLSLAFKDWFAQDGEDGDEKKKILLIDDSAFFRNLIAPILFAAGYDVTSVETAHQAIDLCEQEMEFDAIISDIQMPDMNGFEFAQAIKRDQRWSKTPILAISSRATPEDIEQSRKLGFNDYVMKRDRDALLNSLAQAIGKTMPLHRMDHPDA